jgi:hypothetical protein
VVELHANIDGQMVPLAKCDWVFSQPCGHPFGVLLAVPPGEPPVACATEEQAWQQMYPTARSRKALRERGVTARLAVHAALGDEFWQQMQDGCECAEGVNRRGVATG